VSLLPSARSSAGATQAGDDVGDEQQHRDVDPEWDVVFARPDPKGVVRRDEDDVVGDKADPDLDRTCDKADDDCSHDRDDENERSSRGAQVVSDWQQSRRSVLRRLRSRPAWRRQSRPAHLSLTSTLSLEESTAAADKPSKRPRGPPTDSIRALGPLS